MPRGANEGSRPRLGREGPSRPRRRERLMALRLDYGQADFEGRFRALLAVKRESAADVGRVVEDILADVAARGDAALIDYTRRLDGHDIDRDSLRIRPAEIEAAL